MGKNREVFKKIYLIFSLSRKTDEFPSASLEFLDNSAPRDRSPLSSTTLSSPFLLYFFLVLFKVLSPSCVAAAATTPPFLSSWRGPLGRAVAIIAAA